MTQEVIDIGTAPNDGLGDPLRTAFAKTNNNFSQLFAAGGVSGVANGTSNVNIPQANGNVVISSAGTANVLTVTGTGVNVAGTLNSSGLAILSNLSVTGTTISVGTIQSLADVTAVTVTASGNLSANNAVITGNISAALFTGNGSGLTGVVATGNVGAATQLTNGTTTMNIPVANGNMIGNVGGVLNIFTLSTGGLEITGIASVSGNVTGGNLRTSGLVSATGNIIGNYILGNGACLSGVLTSVANITNGTSNVTVVSSGGNIAVGVSGNANVTVFSSTGQFVQGTISASGNIQGDTFLTSGVVSATGNITGGNIQTGGLISATSNIAGGNILTAGQIISTKTGNSANAAGQIYLNGTGNNRIEFNTSGLAVPNDTTRSAGTKILLYPGIDGSGVDYAIGMESTAMWFSIHDTTRQFNWYANTTAVATLTGTGNFSASGNVTGGNVLTGGIVSATGNVLGNVFTVNLGNTSTAIINGGGNAVGNIGSSSKYFNQVFAQATTALYADLAEIYSADAEYAPGTVVSFGGDQEITRSIIEGDNRVAGVISENPSYLMNSGLQAEHRAAVALTGRVPTLVIGPVCKGDMMISAGNGWARASATPAMGTVIGKALKNFDGDSGIIEIVVGRL